LATADGAPPASYAVVVGPVSVPASVDRPQFVVQVAPNRVEVDEFNRWAAPLDDGVARAVAGNLATLLGTPKGATGSLANLTPAQAAGTWRGRILTLGRNDPASARAEGPLGRAFRAAWPMHESGAHERHDTASLVARPGPGTSTSTLAGRSATGRGSAAVPGPGRRNEDRGSGSVREREPAQRARAGGCARARLRR